MGRILFALTDSWAAVVDEHDDGTPITRREYAKLDAFAAEAGEAAKIPVEFIDVAEVPADLTGVVLIAEEEALHELAERLGRTPESLAGRVFLLNTERISRSGRHVEAIGAAGTITSLTFGVWSSDPEDAPEGNVFGRKDIAAAIGASWTPGQFEETEHYCAMEHQPDHDTLPGLLGAYLRAYLEAS
ncbi:hypothetical protein Afil01_69040 [Actinorhabdospora filicis]|uniref:Uncharacterized protein n=1 Tax=Actinorhabdospora filicis TaxID=1785913 RepID=A0A9W6SUK1_9ACTN|nr:hypothetical protein Afil01_69040 [Actinorhabdospora filicis]